MTITEKIIARHAQRDKVSPGETVWVDVDILMTHDVCGPPTIGIFKREFGADAKVWDVNKLVVMPDHYIFTENPHAIRNVDILREFASEHDLPIHLARHQQLCALGVLRHGDAVQFCLRGH